METTFPHTPLTSIGIDIGKEVFHIVGFGGDGHVAFHRKIKRLALVETFKKLPPCIVGMEACLSAHFVSRALRQLGHEPRIIPAIYVKPFLKGQKNDYNDAEAIAEAALRPNLRTVREKDAGPARSAGLPQSSFAPDLPSHGNDQPNSRLSHRTWYCRQGRFSLPAQFAVGDFEEPEGRDFPEDARSDHGPGMKIGSSSTNVLRRSRMRSRRSVRTRQIASA